MLVTIPWKSRLVSIPAKDKDFIISAKGKLGTIPAKGRLFNIPAKGRLFAIFHGKVGLSLYQIMVGLIALFTILYNYDHCYI